MTRYGRPSGAVALLAATLAAGTGCSDGGSSSPRTPAELGIDLRNAERCDVLVPER